MTNLGLVGYMATAFTKQGRAPAAEVLELVLPLGCAGGAYLAGADPTAHGWPPEGVAV